MDCLVFFRTSEENVGVLIDVSSFPHSLCDYINHIENKTAISYLA